MKLQFSQFLCTEYEVVHAGSKVIWLGRF